MMLSRCTSSDTSSCKSGLFARHTKVPPLRVQLRRLLSRVALWAADLIHRARYAGAQPGADRPSRVACAPHCAFQAPLNVGHGTGETSTNRMLVGPARSICCVRIVTVHSPTQASIQGPCDGCAARCARCDGDRLQRQRRAVLGVSHPAVSVIGGLCGGGTDTFSWLRAWQNSRIEITTRAKC